MRPVPAVREADPAQRLVHPGPDLVGRHAPVLQPERDVVAAAGHHQLGLRVLEDDADPFPGLARVEPVDLDGALLLAGVLGQQPGQRGEQGALAGPGGPEQQHPLAALDAQVDPAHRPGAPPGVPPAEPAQLDVAASPIGGQTAGRVRGRTGKRSSTPVWASARVSTQPPRPAMTVRADDGEQRRTGCGSRPAS